MPQEVDVRRVRVVLGAKLRADWSAVVEVPADATDAELHALVDQFFHRVAMDEYVQDDEFWGKGKCGINDNVDEGERVAYRVVRGIDGKLLSEKLIPGSLWCVVHGAAFQPEVFHTRDAADAFKAQCDDYVSGPWECRSGSHG